LPRSTNNYAWLEPQTTAASSSVVDYALKLAGFTYVSGADAVRMPVMVICKHAKTGGIGCGSNHIRLRSIEFS